jgi:hypothetical protein
MENRDTRPQQSDELDLSQVFNSIGRFFRRAGNNFLYFLASLRNVFFSNRIFFGGIIVIGCVLGAIYSELLKKKFYTSTMVLSCDYLNTQILENTIEKLNLLCSEKDREGLAEVLLIDSRTAKNIQNFEYESFVSEDDVVEMEVLRTQLNNVAADKKELVDKVMSKLEIENKSAYQISVQVYDPEIVKPLEKAILSYFKRNEYISKRIQINQINLRNRKSKLVAESRKLDSLKKVLFENYQTLGKTSRGSNNVILSDEQLANPLEVYTQDLELNKEILDIDEQLHVTPDFEIIDGFTTFKEPDSASLFKILIIAFFVSILVGYIIIGAWRFDAMLAKIDTKSRD